MCSSHTLPTERPPGSADNRYHTKNTEDRGVDGRMRSEWIFGRLTGAVWSDLNWFRIGTVGVLL
jgi:hypothetical protein